MRVFRQPEMKFSVISKAATNESEDIQVWGYLCPEEFERIFEENQKRSN